MAEQQPQPQPQTQTQTLPQARSFPWMPMVFMLFVLLLIGGVVALSYSPLIDHLMKPIRPESPPPPVSDEARGTPAPDNTIKESTRDFPAPDNPTTSSPLRSPDVEGAP